MSPSWQQRCFSLQCLFLCWLVGWCCRHIRSRFMRGLICLWVFSWSDLTWTRRRAVVQTPANRLMAQQAPCLYVDIIHHYPCVCEEKRGGGHPLEPSLCPNSPAVGLFRHGQERSVGALSPRPGLGHGAGLRLREVSVWTGLAVTQCF